MGSGGGTTSRLAFVEIGGIVGAGTVARTELLDTSIKEAKLEFGSILGGEPVPSVVIGNRPKIRAKKIR